MRIRGSAGVVTGHWVRRFDCARRPRGCGDAQVLPDWPVTIALRQKMWSIKAPDAGRTAESRK